MSLKKLIKFVICTSTPIGASFPFQIGSSKLLESGSAKLHQQTFSGNTQLMIGYPSLCFIDSQELSGNQNFYNNNHANNNTYSYYSRGKAQMEVEEKRFVVHYCLNLISFTPISSGSNLDPSIFCFSCHLGSRVIDWRIYRT
jgi:hypothetical protein